MHGPATAPRSRLSAFRLILQPIDRCQKRLRTCPEVVVGVDGKLTTGIGHDPRAPEPVNGAAIKINRRERHGFLAYFETTRTHGAMEHFASKDKIVMHWRLQSANEHRD